MTHTAKHTPGPWTVEQCSAPVYGSDGSIIAEGIGIGTQSTHISTVYGKNSAHNSHLIAAAPAMYEALLQTRKVIEAIDDYQVFEDLQNVLIAINKTLAQAEGH